MVSEFKVLTGQDLAKVIDPQRTFAEDVFLGLSSRNIKFLPSKYLYDNQGSALYELIMQLPEYYLVNAEYNCIERNKVELGKMISGAGERSFQLIELGSGNGLKTKILLEYFLEKRYSFEYIPIDISYLAIEELCRTLNLSFPSLTSQGLVADYFDGIQWVKQHKKGMRNVVLFLGSNIGNLTLSEAKQFLFSLWCCLNNGDYVFIGFDLRKNIELMTAAYNDSQGITARFNLNLLERINTELEGNFDIKKFQHFECYDVYSGAMKSYLLSLEDQEVHIKKLGNKTISFTSWEPIFIEQSYKYLQSEIEMLAKETGFAVLKHFYDSKEYYIDSLWQVMK